MSNWYNNMNEQEGLQKFAHRKRIRQRGIEWKQTYGEKSLPLKKRFDKQLGQNSYLRWEGHDYTSDGDYFVVIGPAITKNGQKKYFAGIKRLPPKQNRKKIYAPSGKYFQDIMQAIYHGNNMWGTPIPQGQQNYNMQHLAGINIPRKMKG